LESCRDLKRAPASQAFLLYIRTGKASPSST